MTKSKVLVLDVETSPLLVYVWGIRDQVIGLDQIHTDWNLLSWSAKWVGSEHKMEHKDLRHLNPTNDKPILKRLWKLLDEADIVVTQNGKKFDSKKINARFMLNGMTPPSPYRHFDTYELVKNVASFTSNKLGYLTEKFCVKHKKTAHKKYPGWSLWIECLAGNLDAWKEMHFYNDKDVLSTEELYLAIRAWAPGSFPKAYEMTDASRECGTCGYVGRMREGKPRKAKKHTYRQNTCPKCGAWQTGEKIKEKP